MEKTSRKCPSFRLQHDSLVARTSNIRKNSSSILHLGCRLSLVSLPPPNPLIDPSSRAILHQPVTTLKQAASWPVLSFDNVPPPPPPLKIQRQAPTIDKVSPGLPTSTAPKIESKELAKENKTLEHPIDHSSEDYPRLGSDAKFLRRQSIATTPFSEHHKKPVKDEKQKQVTGTQRMQRSTSAMTFDSTFSLRQGGSKRMRSPKDIGLKPNPGSWWTYVQWGKSGRSDGDGASILPVYNKMMQNDTTGPDREESWTVATLGNVLTVAKIVDGIVHEPYVRISTKGLPTAHDINRDTILAEQRSFDVIVGFASGEILYYCPWQHRYLRFNKQGPYQGQPVSSVRWISGSENLFMAALANGTLLMMDINRTDMQSSSSKDALQDPGTTNRQILENDYYRIQENYISSNQKKNPVVAVQWTTKSCRRKTAGKTPILTDLALFRQTDGLWSALSSASGHLFIMRWPESNVPELKDVYLSSSAGFLSVQWSLNGKWLAVGGQDDTISLISFQKRQMVMRFEGHLSWVTDITFISGDEQLVSVGDDGRICMWNVPELPDDEEETTSSENWALKVHPFNHQMHISDPILVVANRHNVITACRAGEIRSWLREE